MKVLLILYLIMPGEIPDKQTQKPMASMEECWKQAKTFTENDPKMAGGIGLGAACLYKVEEEKS